MTDALGYTLSLTSSSSATYREVVISWKSALGMWFVSTYTLATSSYVATSSSRVLIQNADLPEPGLFAPYTNAPSIQSLSMSPALSPNLTPLSPGGLQAEEPLDGEEQEEEMR